MSRHTTCAECAKNKKKYIDISWDVIKRVGKKIKQKLKGIHNQLKLLHIKKAHLRKIFRHVKECVDRKLIYITEEINAQADKREANDNLLESEIEECHFIKNMESTFRKL